MSFTRTFDILSRYAEKFPDKPDALTPKTDGEWKGFSTQDYIDYSYNLSYGLIEMGFQKGEKIAVVSNNRPEWNMSDHGISMTGAIMVPLFATLEADGYETIIEHSDSKIAIVGDAELYKKIAPLVDKIPALEKVYTMDEVEGAANWKEILDLGKANTDKHREELENRKNAITEKDCVTLIYTSGTTGNSKGVLLSHENLVTNFTKVSEVFGMTPDQRYLCILPLCHVGERMANYSAQYSGAGIYYAQNMATIADDLKDVKPHAFGTVPRILEKIYDKVVQRGSALKGIKKKMFFWALKLGHEFDVEGKSWWYRWQLRRASKLIFSKWREAIGGNINAVGVGGAALQTRLERVFWAADVKLLNMYGLTETSPVCTLNRLDKIKIGTVGSLLDDVDVKIAEDGEILVKGPNVMIGYYKDEAATADVMKDGWFHTGDIGILDEDGFLKITDR
ncbi:AMP-binding protein, partial [bacterium AH-315-B15]|nr:AMP-binding protein [bacterium AH-315-B15]